MAKENPEAFEVQQEYNRQDKAYVPVQNPDPDQGTYGLTYCYTTNQSRSKY